MLRDRYRKNLCTAIGSSAAPYGYTLTTWTTGAVLTNAGGIPNALDALLFMVGAVSGFAVVGTLAFGGVTKHYVTGSREAALWGAFHFPSVGLAIVAAWLVTGVIQNQLVWPLGAFASTIIYLLVLGVETALTDVPSQEPE